MQVRDALGYSSSTRFFGPERVDDLPANELSFALRLATTVCPKLGANLGLGEEGVQFEGAYVLQREPRTPAVPIVFVVQAENESVVKRIHQFVWNQNQSPFLIVESPSMVRVYPGFTYERDGDTPLVHVAKDAANILKKWDPLESTCRHASLSIL